jgi:hypothetical protein
MKLRTIVGPPPGAAIALSGLLADCRLRDIFSRGIREQMGGMTSS